MEVGLVEAEQELRRRGYGFADVVAPPDHRNELDACWSGAWSLQDPGEKAAPGTVFACPIFAR